MAEFVSALVVLELIFRIVCFGLLICSLVYTFVKIARSAKEKDKKE